MNILLRIEACDVSLVAFLGYRFYIASIAVSLAVKLSSFSFISTRFNFVVDVGLFQFVGRSLFSSVIRGRARRRRAQFTFSPLKLNLPDLCF